MQQLLQLVATTTGKSSVQLGISTAATTAKQLRMVRVAEDPENQEQTSANCSVVVKINLHQYTVGSLARHIRSNKLWLYHDHN